MRQNSQNARCLKKLINALTFTSKGEDEHLTWAQEDALVFDAVFAKMRNTPELPSFDGLSDGEKDTLNKNVERYKQSRVYVAEMDATRKGDLVNFKKLRGYIAGRYFEASDVGVRFKPVSAYNIDYAYVTILASSDGSLSFVDLNDAYKKETAPTINAGDRGQGVKQKLKAVGLLALRFDGDKVFADIENAPFTGDYPGNGSAYDYGFDQSYKHKGKNDEYSVGLTRLIHGSKIGDIQVGTNTEAEKDAYTYGMWSRKPRIAPEHNYAKPFTRLTPYSSTSSNVTAEVWAADNSGYTIVKNSGNLYTPAHFLNDGDYYDADYTKTPWPYTLYKRNRANIVANKRDIFKGMNLPVKRYTGHELDHLVPNEGRDTLATDGQYVFGIVNNRGSAKTTTEDVLYTPHSEIFKLSDLNISVNNLRYGSASLVEALPNVLEITAGFGMGYLLADVTITSTRALTWLKNKTPFVSSSPVPYSRTIAIGMDRINVSTQIVWARHVKAGEDTNEEYDSTYILSLKDMGSKPFRYAGQTYKYYDKQYNINSERLCADFLDNVPDEFIKKIFYPYAWSDYIDYSYANKPTMDALDKAIEKDIGDAKQQHSIVIATSTGGRLQPRLTTGGV